MKAEELKTKTKDELKGLLLDLKKEQFNLRFQLSQGALENTARIRIVRRDIARVMTFLGGSAEAKTAQKKAKAAAPKAEKAKPAAKKKTTGKKSAA